MMPDNGPVQSRIVATNAWRLTAPESTDESSPLVCVPTVHPRGDQRIIRCAQSALDAGFRVHFVWGGEGEPAPDVAVTETILPRAASTRERLRQLGRLGYEASQVGANALHVHDFYFLPWARAWALKNRRPVVYDVHEYYPDYYSSKLPLPFFLKNRIARLIAWYERRTAARLGYVNAVAEAIGARFDADLSRIAVSPNYPILPPARNSDAVPFRDRMLRVVHTGTLDEAYGMSTLLALASELQRRGSALQIDAIARFPSNHARLSYERAFVEAGSPHNLHLLSPVAAHEVIPLVETYGFGLSLLRSGGQRDIAIPTKLFEYVLAGVVVVGTDREAQAEIVRASAVGSVLDQQDVPGMADALESYFEDPDATSELLRIKRAAAEKTMTWTHSSGPAVTGLYRDMAARFSSTSSLSSKRSR